MSNNIPDKDDEFLLWIAKRLVFKYNESQDILKQVSRILAKNRVVKNIFYEQYNTNQIALTRVVEYISNLQKINNSSMYSLQSKTNLNFQQQSLDNTHSSILENIDMDSFLKGV